MTFDAETATYENGLKCSYCGEHDRLYWTEHVRKKLIAQQACHGCGFWLDHARRDLIDVADKYRHVITADWGHYIIGSEEGGRFRGFGGARFTVEWFDKDRPATVTTNLWHQGTIPEHMRHRFEVNAELASGVAT